MEGSSLEPSHYFSPRGFAFAYSRQRDSGFP